MPAKTKRGKSAAESAPVEERDWVIEGLKTLAEMGVDGVKVERLASTLGISKGPFYWRFSNRNELLDAMLELWRREFTAALIEQSAPFASPRARIEALMEGVLVAQWRGVDVARVEGAIRAWAAQDPRAGQVVRDVDQLRVAHLVRELGLIGIGAEEAEKLAKGIYLALLGLYTTRQYTPELADDAALRSLVGFWLDQIEASAAKAKSKPRRAS